jgi:hypothetical protein
MTDLRNNIAIAVEDGRAEVFDRLERLAAELDATAGQVRALQVYLSDETWVEHLRTAAPIAGALGALLRQPLGQNAQELVLRSLASLAEDEGALRALSLTEDGPR